MVATAARESEKFPLFSDDQQFCLAAVDRQVEKEAVEQRESKVQRERKVKRIRSLLHLLCGVYFLFSDENY